MDTGTKKTPQRVTTSLSDHFTIELGTDAILRTTLIVAQCNCCVFFARDSSSKSLGMVLREHMGRCPHDRGKIA
jgi:hypothetical protein